MKLFLPIKQLRNFPSKLGFGMLLILIGLLTACSVDTPAPIQVEQQESTLINDFISSKWVGTSKIPTTILGFIDEGENRTSCFSFTEVWGTNVTDYEWKSDIYISNNSPQQVWFYTTKNETNGIELSSLEESGDSFFYFILRYNVKDEHLDHYLIPNEGKYYSVQYVLNTISDKVRKVTNQDGTVTPSFKDYSIYIPVIVRDIRSDGRGGKYAQMNFPINFHALPVDEEPDWQEIFDKLKKNTGYTFVKDYWTDYHSVINIENGNNGCPNF